MDKSKNKNNKQEEAEKTEALKEKTKEKIEEKDKNIEKKKEIYENEKKDLDEEEKEKEDKKKVKNNESKPVISVKTKKNEAIVNGKNLSISTKEAVAVCSFIRNKNIEIALMQLDEVLNYKKAIPMKGEIPHRKGKIMSGRYPIKAVKEFIKLLKSLKANALVNELELEKFKIFCMANQASRPYKRFGQGRMKRSHVIIKLM